MPWAETARDWVRHDRAPVNVRVCVNRPGRLSVAGIDRAGRRRGGVLKRDESLASRAVRLGISTQRAVCIKHDIRPITHRGSVLDRPRALFGPVNTSRVNAGRNTVLGKINVGTTCGALPAVPSRPVPARPDSTRLDGPHGMSVPRRVSVLMPCRAGRAGRGVGPGRADRSLSAAVHVFVYGQDGRRRLFTARTAGRRRSRLIYRPALMDLRNGRDTSRAPRSEEHGGERKSEEELGGSAGEDGNKSRFG